MPLQEVSIAGRPPGGVQRDQIERRSVRSAVIRRVRDQLEMRQFAVADLMQDLARLGVAVVVRFFGLQGAENLERSAARTQDR